MLEKSSKSLESWIWGAACSIRGAQDAPKFKEFILPLIFAKRLCDVFDDEIDRIAKEVGSRAKAFRLVKHDKKLVRFYLPLQPSNPDESVWSVIRTLSDKIGEQLTTHLSPTPTRFSRGSSTAWISTPPPMVSAISPMTASPIS
jgi:type I restriction enzyme M protein